MKVETLARLANAVLIPGALIAAAWGSKPLRQDQIWAGVMTLLTLWMLRRLWVATDYDRPYKFRTLKICGWLIAFGMLNKAVMALSG